MPWSQIEQSEVTRPDVTSARAGKQFAAAFEHVDAHVVEIGAGHLARAAHADVVGGIGALAAGAVGDQQVVPAVVIDRNGGFGVDRDVHRRAVRVTALSGLGIQLDQPDVTEVGPIREPQPPVGGEQHARINGIAVFDAIGPDDRPAIFPVVVRRGRIERFADEQPDRRLRLRARRGVVEKEFIADVDDVRRPGVVSAAGEHRGSGLAIGQRGHQRARATPGPAVIGSQDRKAVAGAESVVAARVRDDRRGIVDEDVAVERIRRQRKRSDDAQQEFSQHGVTVRTAMPRVALGVD